MDAVTEKETQRAAEQQRRHDYEHNYKAERAICPVCGTIVPFTVDGRCMACYDARALQLFGVVRKSVLV